MSDDGFIPEGWNPAAPKESATEFNGVFSWAGESHAFTLGFGIGIAGERELMVGFAGYAVAGGKANFEVGDDAHLRQVVEEPAYALGGLALGYVANRVALGQPIHEALLALLTGLGVM